MISTKIKFDFRRSVDNRVETILDDFVFVHGHNSQRTISRRTERFRPHVASWRFSGRRG